MGEAENGNGPDPDEATALEIGMSFVKARRVIAEAERLAREFVLAPVTLDQRPADVISVVGDGELVSHVTVPRPDGIDLAGLAAQVDEIEETLLNSHARILRLCDEAFGEVAAAHPAEKAPDAKIEAAPDESPEATDPAPRTEPEATSSNGDSPSTNGSAAATHAPSSYLASQMTASIEEEPPGGSQATWGPPDPSSRVDVPAPVVLREEPSAVLAGPEPEVSEAPEVNGLAGPLPHEATVQPSGPVLPPQAFDQPLFDQPAFEHPAADAPVTEPQARVVRPAKSASNLWLLNVIGFSVLLILVVVVLMLANVL